MNFRVNQKIICVDDAHQMVRPGKDHRVRKGQIYTIRALGENLGHPVVMLHGIVNAKTPAERVERGYCVHRFRPIVERSTDISILTALLNPENHREMVDHDQR